MGAKRTCEWCGTSYLAYSKVGRWCSGTCKQAAAAKDKADRQALRLYQKRVEVVALLDELVTTAYLNGYSPQFYALSARLRNRGLSFHQVYGLVESFQASRLRAFPSADSEAVLRVLALQGANVREFADYHAELVDYLCGPAE